MNTDYCIAFIQRSIICISILLSNKKGLSQKIFKAILTSGSISFVPISLVVFSWPERWTDWPCLVRWQWWRSQFVFILERHCLSVCLWLKSWSSVSSSRYTKATRWLGDAKQYQPKLAKNYTRFIIYRIGQKQVNSKPMSWVFWNIYDNLLSWCLSLMWLGTAAYQLGNTSSRTITEVKQRWAWLVLGWETVQV